VALVGFTGWLWEPSDSGVLRDTGLPGIRLPVNIVDRRSHLYFATVGALLISFALYASLIFAGLFLWNTNPVASEATAAPEGLAAIGALAGAGLMAALAVVADRLSVQARFIPGALLDLGVMVAALGTGLALWLALQPVDPWATAFGAVGWAIGAFVGVHLAIVVYWALFNTLRKLTGRVRPGQTLPDLLLSTFTNGTAIMAIGVAVALLIVGVTP
jgi:cytochrome c oxidase subunit I+III